MLWKPYQHLIVNGSLQARMAERKRLAWVCQTCEKECIPIRTESRCICGHRHKEHVQGPPWSCKAARCSCQHFFYIVGEGSWILRCRCKHKHTEHDSVTHACKNTNCQCQKFLSPWVCNCDHPWSDHKQAEVKQEKSRAFLEAVGDINRWDLLKRGQGAD